MLCTNCLSQGYCRFIKVQLVPVTALRDPDYLTDLKKLMRLLSFQYQVTPEGWFEFLVILYRDYLGWIEGPDGEEIFLNLEVFDFPSRREWFRDFMRIVAGGVVPRLRKESVPRVQAIATILTASFPQETFMLGVRGANDNDRQEALIDTPSKGCPFR